MINKLKKKIFDIINSLSWLKITKKIIAINIKKKSVRNGPERCAAGNKQHKLAYNKNIPLSGGIYFFIAILTNTLLTEYYDQNFLIIIFLFLFLILGIYSDLITNFTPRIRLLCQIALVILIIVFLDLKIDKTNVFFLDYYIDNRIFNLFACGAIFYNHESPRRSSEYVTQKIVETVCKIYFLLLFAFLY